MKRIKWKLWGIGLLAFLALLLIHQLAPPWQSEKTIPHEHETDIAAPFVITGEFDNSGMEPLSQGFDPATTSNLMLLPPKDRAKLIHVLKVTGYDPQTDPPLDIQPSNVSTNHPGAYRHVRPQLHRRYENDSLAEQKFLDYLKKREAAYPQVEPPAGTISVEAAINVAMETCTAPFDRDQKPRVDLYNGIYHVTLYQHRSPKLAFTTRAGSILVNAHTGEVVETRLIESEKRATTDAVE